MSERKVATRQERLMSEQIIREDMKNGIQREIIDSPQVQNNSNQSNKQNQIRTPNYNNFNQGK